MHPTKVTFFPLFYFTLHTEVNGPEGELQLLRYFYLQLYKIQRTGVQMRAPLGEPGSPLMNGLSSCSLTILRDFTALACVGITSH